VLQSNVISFVIFDVLVLQVCYCRP